MDNIKRGPNNFNRNFHRGIHHHGGTPIRKPIPQKTPVAQKPSIKSIENIKTEVTKPVESSGEKQEEIELKPFRGYAPITRFSQDKSPNRGPNMTMMVVAIVIVMLVIVGIFFLFSKTKLSQTGIESQNLDMKIQNVQMENNSVKLNLEIDPKEENLVGIKFIFDDGSNFEVFKEDISITSLNEKEFVFELKNVDPSKIKKILIAPIFENEGEEKIIGSIKDTYIPTSEDLANLPNYVPEDYSVYVNYTERYGNRVNYSYNDWLYDYTINQTNCANHTSSKCYNGDVYWYNSCNLIQEIKSDCNSTQYCFNSTCMNNQTAINNTNQTNLNNQTKCGKQGESFDFSNSSNPSSCCSGLKNVHTSDSISVGDKCYPTGTVSGAPILTCSNCGNGICEDVESVCGCNIDCKNKNKSAYSTLSDFCASGLNRVYCSELAYFNESVNLCKLCLDLINQTTQNITTPICGNGILEKDEYCDMNNLAGETCQSFGYKSGELGCRKNCLFDIRYCSDYTGIITENITKECTNYSYSGCYSGNVYWYDSCDKRQTIKESCLSDETCTNGECVVKTLTCSGSSTQTCNLANAVGTQTGTCNTATGQWSWGTCTIASCNTGYGNCDNTNSNGCETTLGTNNHCASCTNVCSTGQTCTNRVCVTTSLSCSGSSTQACNLANAVGTQTGTCNTATGQWSWGTCTIASCNTGYGNCDNTNSNGCETTLGTNNHCASCTNVCSTGQTCTNRVCVTSNPETNSGYIIADHTDTLNFNNIPTEWITKAKQDLHIAYMHTSHGSQIVSGMNAISRYSPFNGLYSYSSTGGTNTLHLQETGFSLSCGADLSQCDGNILATTRSLLDNSANQDINVVMWSWCSIAGHNIDAYLTSMQTLMTEYGNGKTSHPTPVKFVFMTGHAEGGGEGDSSDSRNTQIRNFVKTGSFCQTHQCILFDFSDIENYDPDGNYYLDKRVEDGLQYDCVSPFNSGSKTCTWATEYLAKYPNSKEKALTDLVSGCAHSPESGESSNSKLNCALKGEAIWSLWARLAGWDGVSTQ